MRPSDLPCGQHCLSVSFGDVYSEASAACGKERPQVRKPVYVGKKYKASVAAVLPRLLNSVPFISVSLQSVLNL